MLPPARLSRSRAVLIQWSGRGRRPGSARRPGMPCCGGAARGRSMPSWPWMPAPSAFA